MIPKTLSERANLVPKDELLEHASLSVLRNANVKVPEIVGWEKGNVISKPLTIYDINGSPLFYDYRVSRGSRVLGTVRTGASKILGAPVIAHEFGPRYWNFRSAVQRLTPQVHKEHPRWEIRRTRLVCYSYPKLGVMFEAVDENGKKKRLIYDVATFDPIPEKPPAPGVEGVYAWSFYDALPGDVRELGLKQFDQLDNWRLEIPGKIRDKFKGNRTLTRFEGLIHWPRFRIRVESKMLQFCEHYDYNEARSHHCFILHCQQKSDYCAVATCQMILCYYRYYYSQDEIAPRLGYRPGGCPPNQSAGYKSLTCNHLDATFDSSPTWEEARDQINALHPLKSGVPGHARACAGYAYLHWEFLDFSIELKHLLIYDPWPWNPDLKAGGSVYWELWNSITHTDFIFTKIKC